MSREVYHKELKKLEKEVVKMAGMASTAITDSIKALKDRDIKTSEAIIKNDININVMRYEIEEKCLELIATQQPMAVDLRTLAAILSVITDIERIADHGEGNAKISLLIGDSPVVKPLIDIPRMTEIAISMLDRCVTAFIERDAEAARDICAEDDKVDELYDQVYRELLLLMIENPKQIEGATYLIWVAHNIERVADRVTNIAERVVFMVTGKMEEINVSSY
ncbi:MAG: phosphate signaling complex protein PhoU [Deltaproteobacteria bacterium]|nr:phosphate signaling complex protein PhoU [Deltaproteobacteria bacterium]